MNRSMCMKTEEIGLQFEKSWKVLWGKKALSQSRSIQPRLPTIKKRIKSIDNRLSTFAIRDLDYNLKNVSK